MSLQQWYDAGMQYLYIYLRVFVCLFSVNAKTTVRIGTNRSGITKNDTESVLRGLKLVFPFFSFAADRHFYLLPSTSSSCPDSF